RPGGSLVMAGTGPNLQPVAADGTFTIEHVTPGRVSVMLMSGRAGAYTSTASVDAEVREGETTPLQVSLRHVGVSGHVTRGGAPLAGARVEFQPGLGMRMYMSTGPASGADGLPANVAITREDGTYQVTVGQPGDARVTIQTPDGKGRFPTTNV